MKILKRRDNQPAGRRVNESSSSKTSSPIVRYYRPQQRSAITQGASGNGRISTELRHANHESKSSRDALKKAGRLISQWFVLLAIIGLLIVNVSLSGVSIRVKGSTYAYRTNDQYQAIVGEILASRPVFRTKATLSSSSLEEEIKKQLPEVETATAIIPLAGRRLQVLLDVSSPLVRLQTGTNKLAVVSASGVVTNEDSSEVINSTFAELPSLSMVGITPKVGAQLLTQDESALIKLLSQEFDGSDETRPNVQSLEFDVKKREIKVRFKNETYYAKVTPEEEGRLQVGALHKTIQELKEQRTPAAEYIDVRVQDRVFVR